MNIMFKKSDVSKGSAVSIAGRAISAKAEMRPFREAKSGVGARSPPRGGPSNEVASRDALP